MDKDKLKKFILQQKELYFIDGIFLEQTPNFTTAPKSFSSPITTDKEKSIELLRQKINSCKKCPLGEYRLNPVFGEGNINANLMFVGEGPGYNEDHLGRPFVGRAGDLLTKIIEAMKLSRQEVFIANIVKCHPMKTNNPELRNNDRPPTETEIESCLPYLIEQIKIIKPKVICCLGSVSAKVLTKNDLPITQLRGKIFNFYEDKQILVIPTYHPAALLRNPTLKKLVWDDMKLIMKYL